MTEKKNPPGTFDFQGSLPKLPVPSLEETLGKLLLWTTPLLDEHGRKETSEAVRAFLAPDGAGRKLQHHLEEHAKKTPFNWLDAFWLRTYLDSTAPLVINSNVFYLLDLPLPSGGTPRSQRGAELITSALAFKKSIDEETLSPDMDKQVPLCMEQYRRLFGGTRIPGESGDELRISSKSRHIVVLAKGRAWMLHILSPDGETASLKSILRRLEEIYSSESWQQPGEGIGIGTALERRKWAVLRNQLKSFSPENSKHLEIIESALFILCLDERTGSSLDEKGFHYLSGGDGNRWYDKSLQLIVGEDGEAAMNMEHSGLDGSVLARLAAFLPKKRNDKADEIGWQPPSPLPLPFLLSQEIAHELKDAERSLARLREKTRLHVLEFSSFGREKIKRLGISPDAFCQTALQTTIFDMYGRFVTAYESVMTRRFLLGRTEAMRPVTPETAVFVRARTADNLKAAGTAHSERLRECRDGRGVDRHLFGLRKMMELSDAKFQEESPPALFSSPGCKALARNVLSTSTSSTEGFRLCGYGPVDDEGFGVRYLMFPDKLTFTMTCRTELEPGLLSFREKLSANLERMAAILSE